MKARVKQTYAVYSITNTVTGKRYIGLTNNPRLRKRMHFNALKRGKHHSAKLQNSFDKYGIEAFIWEILESGIPQSKIKRQEIRWIALFDSYANGYNHTKGGDFMTANTKPCVWDGVSYASLSEAADAIGVSITTLSNRLARGYTKSSDLVRPNAGTDRKCVWDGIEYQNLTLAAKTLGVSANVLRRRIKNGCTCDADVEAMQHKVFWNNVAYSSIRACAEAQGISTGSMQDRLEKGYTSDSDMANAINKTKVPVTWNGIEFSSIKEACAALGISRDAMWYRLRKGYTCDADLTHPNCKKSA